MEETIDGILYLDMLIVSNNIENDGACWSLSLDKHLIWYFWI